jgi:hypothetical protein
MSQLVKTKDQANFEDFKRFGAYTGPVEQKYVVFNSFVCKLGSLWHSWANSCHKEPNLHTNSLNKLRVIRSPDVRTVRLTGCW